MTAHTSAPADASSVEQQLQQLWRSEAEKSDSGPVLCSRTLNLIVYCRELADLQTAGRLLDPIVERHPCRTILVSTAGPETGQDIETEVSASCLTSYSGNRYIGRELIRLAAKPSAHGRLASIVGALVLPDLPVFLWWRDARSLGSELFQWLQELAPRIIVDSAGLEDLQADWPKLLQLTQRASAAVSDLAWSRITPWRQLIAQQFDGPIRAPYLRCLHRVVVDYSPDKAAAGIPADAMLLAAWIGRQLGHLGYKGARAVHPESAPEHHITAAWELSNGDAGLRIELRQGNRHGRGVTAVVLSCHPELPATFAISRTQDGKGLATRAELPGKAPVRRVVRLGGESTSDLVGKELEILGRDRLYEDVLQVASGLVPANP